MYEIMSFEEGRGKKTREQRERIRGGNIFLPQREREKKKRVEKNDAFVDFIKRKV